MRLIEYIWGIEKGESKMLDQINTAFKDLDAQMLERQTEWALKRRIAIKECIKNNEHKFVCPDGYTRTNYYKLFDLAGGKKWYNVMYPSTEERVITFVAKNIKATISKRNARIVSALNHKGIFEIPEFTLQHSSDGYEGYFNVAGHRVTINTILAGGFNIQCLHQRTLIKVK